MKQLKTIVLFILAVSLPFLFLITSVGHEKLTDLAEAVMYLIPLYFPVLFAWFGISIAKSSQRIYALVTLVDTLVVFLLSMMAKVFFSSISRSLGDALIFLLMMGPLVYSIPISFLAAAIRKRQIQRDSSQITSDGSVEGAQE